MDYVLIDLERSIQSGMMHYWKANSNGYTRNIEDAGVYNATEASKHILSDVDKRTVGIPKYQIDRILGK